MDQLMTACDPLALHLGQDVGQVGGLLVVDLADDDGDAVLAGQFLELLLARIAEAVVARDDADVLDALCVDAS